MVHWCVIVNIYIYIYIYINNTNTTKKKKLAKYICINSIILSVIIQYTSYIKGYFIQENIIQTFRLWTILNFSNLGYVLMENNKKNHNELLFLVYLISIIFQFYIGKYMNNFHAEYFYDAPIIIILVSLIWINIMNIKLKNNDYIKYVSKLTIGVYPIHILVISVLRKFLLNGFIVFILTILLSFFLSMIINKSKLAKYLVKL